VTRVDRAHTDRLKKPVAVGPGVQDINLISLPDDILPEVLTKIYDAQVAARVLAAWGSASAAIPVPLVHDLGTRTPVISQVQVTSAFLRSPEYDPSRNRGLEMAANHGWVKLHPLLLKHGERWRDEATRQAARPNRLQVVHWGRNQDPPSPGGGHAKAQPKAATSICCSGRVPSTCPLRGGRPVALQPSTANSSCSSGRAPRTRPRRGGWRAEAQPRATTSC